MQQSGAAEERTKGRKKYSSRDHNKGELVSQFLLRNRFPTAATVMNSLMNLARAAPIGFASIINVHKGKRGTLGAIPVFCFEILNGVTGRSIADAKCPRNRCADCVQLVD